MLLAQDLSDLGSTALTLAAIASVTGALLVLVFGIRNRNRRK